MEVVLNTVKAMGLIPEECNSNRAVFNSYQQDLFQFWVAVCIESGIIHNSGVVPTYSVMKIITEEFRNELQVVFGLMCCVAIAMYRIRNDT